MGGRQALGSRRSGGWARDVTTYNSQQCLEQVGTYVFQAHGFWLRSRNSLSTGTYYVLTCAYIDRRYQHFRGPRLTMQLRFPPTAAWSQDGALE